MSLVIAFWKGIGHETSVPWFSIVPPLAAIILAFVLQKIHISLFLAIILGGLLTRVPEAPLQVANWGWGFWQGFHFIITAFVDGTNIQILLFVVAVMAMISVLLASGGLKGIIIWLERYAGTRRSAQVITVIMGFVVFIDDYANTMLVGSSMRPVTDRFKISREKLAFLVDSTSAPIAGLAFISTWIGYEVGLFNDLAQSLAIPKGGYSLFFDALNYRFYCIIMILFVLVNVRTLDPER